MSIMNTINGTFNKIIAYSQTKTSFPLSQIFSASMAIQTLAFGAAASVVLSASVLLGWAGGAVTIGVGTYALTSYIIRKVATLKRIQQAFLMNESERFNLEVYFDDDLEKEFKKEIPSDKKFEVIGNLNGIKLRKKENAR